MAHKYTEATKKILPQLVDLQEKYTINFKLQINRTQMAVDNLVQVIHRIASEAESQVDEITNIVSVITNFSKDLEKFSAESSRSQEIHQSTMEVANQGKLVTKQTGDAMVGIESAVGSIQTVLHDLTNRAAEIEKIASSIQDIAQNSKILSINASIEAARAGDAGRGFGVVADEMGKMALKTSDAVKQISEVTDNIQNGIKNTFTAMAKSQEQVSQGQQIVTETTEVFHKIIDSIQQSVSINDHLLNALNEQNAKFQEIFASIQHLDKVSQGLLFLNEISSMETGNSQTALQMLTLSMKQLEELTINFQKTLPKASEIHEEVLRTCAQTPLKSFDPHMTFDVETNRVLMNVHAGLLSRSITNDVLPGLAKSWHIQEDLRTWVFNLRRGARFHNGREVTANDIKWSYERILSPELNSQNAWFLFPIKHAEDFNKGIISTLDTIRVNNRYQVEIELSIPDISFLNNLAQATCAILAQEEVRKGNFIGAGPYTISKYENNTYYLEAFQNYFAGPPYVNIIEVLDSHEDAIAKFNAGKLDFLFLENDEILTLETNHQGNQIQKKILLMNQFGAFNFNRNSIYQKSADLREAINYAINKQRIIDTVWGGYAEPIRGILPEGIYSDPSLRGYPYDVSKAKQIVKRSGIQVEAHPFKILKAQHKEGMKSLRTQMLEFISEDLQKIGIPVQIVEVPQDQYFTHEAADQADLFLMAWLADTGDADNYLRPLFSYGNFANFGGFNHPEIERKLDAIKPILNGTKRRNMYLDIQKEILDEVPWLLLFSPAQTFIHQPSVKNFHISQLGKIHYEDLMKIQSKNE